MTFGLESRVSRRRAMRAGAALLSLCSLGALAGCGGGGGGTGGGTTGGDGTRTVPLTGTVIDVGTSQPVPNVIIKFNGKEASTGNDGTFTLAAIPTTGTATVTVQGPADAQNQPLYHATVRYQGRHYSGGTFSIAAIGTRSSVALGTIYIANVDYPPFEPEF